MSLTKGTTNTIRRQIAHNVLDSMGSDDVRAVLARIVNIVTDDSDRNPLESIRLSLASEQLLWYAHDDDGDLTFRIYPTDAHEDEDEDSVPPAPCEVTAPPAPPNVVMSPLPLVPAEPDILYGVERERLEAVVRWFADEYMKALHAMADGKLQMGAPPYAYVLQGLQLSSLDRLAHHGMDMEVAKYVGNQLCAYRVKRHEYVALLQALYVDRGLTEALKHRLERSNGQRGSGIRDKILDQMDALQPAAAAVDLLGTCKLNRTPNKEE